MDTSICTFNSIKVVTECVISIYVSRNRGCYRMGDKFIVTFNGIKAVTECMIQPKRKRKWKQAIMGDMKYVQLLARLGCLDK